MTMTQPSVTIPSASALADAFDRGLIREISRGDIAAYLDCYPWEVPLTLVDEMWAEICRREGDPQ